MCRNDLADNSLCFLKKPYYAHATNIEALSSIKKDGIKVMPLYERNHTFFKI